MTVENISWPISTKECCQTLWERTPDLQLDALPMEAGTAHYDTSHYSLSLLKNIKTKY